MQILVGKFVVSKCTSSTFFFYFFFLSTVACTFGVFRYVSSWLWSTEISLGKKRSLKSYYFYRVTKLAVLFCNKIDL